MAYESKCDTEYERLDTVLVCEPKYMAIQDVINLTQEQYKNEGINSSLAQAQHQKFIQTLEREGIDVVTLEPYEKFSEQVFTRDIGFTLGRTIFVAEMARDVRKGEELVFKEWLQSHSLSFVDLTGQKIEGGDVIIDRSSIYIGQSHRTNSQAIQNIRQHLPDYEVFSFSFDKKYLHLDCVFNIVSPEEALVFSPAFSREDLAFLKNRYDVIEIDENEQFLLGTNVLSIGNKKIISLPQNSRINNMLIERGYDVIEIDISEIIKSGGSFRCCTLPIKRQLVKD